MRGKDGCRGERAGARDAEGERRYIHSSSGIYSRLEERRERGGVAFCAASHGGEGEWGGERQLWRE